MLRLLIAPLLLLELAALGFSQPAPQPMSAAVSGVVSDAGQGPIEGVEVQLISLTDGRIVSDYTDIAGKFEFTELPSGRYTLGFFHDRYAAQRLPPVELLPGSPLEISIHLEPLPPPQTRPTAGIENIALEYGMVREQIANVPVLVGTDGRTTVDKLMLLTPGLTPVQSLETDPISGRAAAVSANGSRQSAINYQLDGASNNAQNRISGAQAATFAPAPEAIETFRAVTHTYSAKQGRNAGAVILPETRQGGDNWHGQLRAFYRPRQNPIEAFDGSEDSLSGWVGGGQIGGPVWPKRKLYLFLDGEGWTTTQRRDGTANVLSQAERSGDLSALDPAPRDPTTNAPFPNGIIPRDRLHPLMRSYLDAFLPLPNEGETVYRSRQNFDSGGQMTLERLDFKPASWTVGLRHVLHRNNVSTPFEDLSPLAPGTVNQRRQLANHLQLSATQTLAPSFTHTTRVSMQRLSIGGWLGRPDYRYVTANEFGFDFASFGSNPGTIPDVRLYDDQGFTRLWIAPFLSSDNSVQTTYQLSHDLEWRAGPAMLRGGFSYHGGMWPFQNTENFAGSFSFPSPPDPPIRARPNGLRDLLLGRPGQWRLQTPRELDLRWREFAAYAEGEIRASRNLQFTLGVRYEAQPPAVDSQDRIAAFRPGKRSERFPDVVTGLIFPGDADGDDGRLPRSTVETQGRQVAPRVGVVFSPTSQNVISRWLLGEPGRSVVRASYGTFYDFGAFAGSSSAALFRANYPPFTVDSGFDVPVGAGSQSFVQPLGTASDPCGLVCRKVRYPTLVFSPDFQNARAHQWNLGFQRLLPGGVFLSAIYAGTRSLNLQRQRELNKFVRIPGFGFAFVRNMRPYTLFTDVRQYESSGWGRYNALQLRANRYLRDGLAFELGYTLSRSDDNGSSVFGDELVTESWGVSSYDRRHNLTASWVQQLNTPRSWPSRMSFLDRWSVSGVWRWRSGLPLDLRQDEDPTFTFERVGRPDVVGEFRALDPSETRTFTLADGRTVSGRFAFDPTAFAAVVPTNFNETRPGTLGRNAFRMRGYQQWDFRLSRPVDLGELLTAEIGMEMVNAFGNKNWDAPFANVDQPYFGIVRRQGVGRTFQAVMRLEF